MSRNDELSHHSKNSIAVGSRVSVERTDFVSTGIVTFIEGDIIEIELSQARYYKLGDAVKITVYSVNGFLILPSSIIGKDHDVIMILNPPENQRLIQRRQFSRIDMDGQGSIFSLTNTAAVRWLETPVPLRINNISLGGVGLIVMESSIPAQVTTKMEAELDIIGGFRCTLEIMRKQDLERGVFFGTKYIELSPQQLTSLRGFIIRIQIETRLKQRRDEAEASL